MGIGSRTGLQKVLVLALDLDSTILVLRVYGHMEAEVPTNYAVSLL